MSCIHRIILYFTLENEFRKNMSLDLDLLLHSEYFAYLIVVYLHHSFRVPLVLHTEVHSIIKCLISSKLMNKMCAIRVRLEVSYR